jgi:hypothetical protein
MTNYELFWLRELLGGVLGGEYGGKGKSLADLPINETLAGRVHCTPALGSGYHRQPTPALPQSSR